MMLPFKKKKFQIGSDAHPDSHSMGSGELGKERPKPQARHLPPSSAEVNKGPNHDATFPLG